MKPELNTIIQGDVLEVLKSWPDEFIDCVVTSPPYWGLRDYDVEGQIGLEKTLQEYLDKMLAVTAELKRVLKKTGTMFWNHGDSYASVGKVGGDFGQDGKISKGFSGRGRIIKGTYQEKSLLFQNFRLALRMMDEQGWIMRNTIIWHKPNCMPSSVKDRFTIDFEPVFFFTKSKKYWFETQYEPLKKTLKTHQKRKEYKHNEARIQSQESANRVFGDLESIERINFLGRNKRAVWKIPTHPYPEAHFATFPEELIVTPIKAGCPLKGITLDPFMGSGTTALVARHLGRNYLGIEISKDYIKLAERRLSQQVLL